MQDFIELVKTMRDLQKDYFSIRSPSLLQLCKKKEHEVDKILADLQNSEQPKQHKLI